MPYLLSLSSSQRDDPINETTTNFSIKYNRPISLEGGEHEIALVSATIPYNIYNISAFNNNNKLYLNVNGVPHVITFPDGLYGVSDIQSEVWKQLGLETDNDRKFGAWTILVDLVRLKIFIVLNQNTSVDFTQPDTIREIIGYSSQILSGDGFPIYSDEIVNMENNDIQYYLTCNLVNSDYTRQGPNLSNILYSFRFQTSAGNNYSIIPLERIYLPMNSQNFDTIRITMINQNGKIIDLNGDNIVVNLKIRPATNQN